jgi:2'-5' RNA ligase
VRLFIAVDLSDAERAAVTLIQRAVIEGLAGGGRLRLVKPEQQHLTLVFIGEVEEDRGRRIVQVMERTIPLAPFSVGFREIAAVPPRGAPRVLILAAGEGAESAVQLHAYLVDLLADEGVPRDRRPFRPHLTLGRWRESRPFDRPRASSAGGSVDVEVRRVTLFQSRLSPAGPSYTRLATAPLICP